MQYYLIQVSTSAKLTLLNTSWYRRGGQSLYPFREGDKKVGVCRFLYYTSVLSVHLQQTPTWIQATREKNFILGVTALQKQP